MWDKWVLDATMGVREGLATFCPITDDGVIVVGMNMVGCCPGECVGVAHADGQKAAVDWVGENPSWYCDYVTKENDDA